MNQNNSYPYHEFVSNLEHLRKDYPQQIYLNFSFKSSIFACKIGNQERKV